MDKNEIEKLRQIKTLPALIKYLRDELDWPISEDAVEDDVVFEYKAEELGLSSEYDHIVKEIKQIRPLTASQPWGVFWVNFDKKKLPVVILRRILSKLVLKKRTSGAKAKQATWAMHDLLFISSYGEASDRAVTFAHFYQEDKEDLPILKVLGWDDGDTVPHLADAHKTLKEKLHWPEDPKNVSKWNADWASAFVLRHREVIDTTEKLVEELARLAKSILKRAKTALRKETEKGPLRRLHSAFKETLIHDLTEEDFADVLAQTISYGLLTARFTSSKNINVKDLVDMVPKTNPFLKELLGTFLSVSGRNQNFDFDELGIQDVVELLNMAKVDAIKNDFGNKSKGEDPVIHFYEHFLSAYNKEQKIQRGVFYTPQPVVSYIVRSVHELLKTKFGLEDGLASTVTWEEMLKKNRDLKIPKEVDPSSDFIQVLDPATGTATFLVEVIDIIYKTMIEKWKKQGFTEGKRLKAWNEYVPEHLLTRLHGFELMMAPYAIAHMKIGLKLSETGYEFASNKRARIYLTNSLEPVQDFSGSFDLAVPALAHEAHEVNAIKGEHKFTIVIGNPPYSGLSANLNDYARSLVRKYKFINGSKIIERGALQFEKNLQEDYIKFLSFSENCINDSGIGICGLVCNNGYVDNPTLRGVRWHLMQSFQNIWILNLHGNVNRGDVSPDGSQDQNVFDIKKAGISILLCEKNTDTSNRSYEIFRSDLWGDRLSKYEYLLSKSIANQEWEIILSEPDLFLFKEYYKSKTKEYKNWIKITDIFTLYSAGMITARDEYVIDFEMSPVLERAKAFRNSKLSDKETCVKLGIPIKKGWNIKRARQRIREVKEMEQYIKPVLYRPFDIRSVFYHESLIWGMAWPVMQHMIKGTNLALITSRMTKGEDFQHALVSNTISEVILLSSKTSNNAFVFPLYQYSGESDLQLGDQNNFNRKFVNLLYENTGLMLGDDEKNSITPIEVFYYIYAILNSPVYRKRYIDYLRSDFPRIPIIKDIKVFIKLSNLGNMLVDLHLMKSDNLKISTCLYVGPKNPGVEKISWENNTVWVDKAREIGFTEINEDIWKFHIGGYQVCEKWLKYRIGRKLSNDDIAHYQKIVVAISETIRIMKEIDKVIDEYGGWPKAFE